MDPAGEANGGTLRLDFDRRLRLQFRAAVITSDAGLLAYRELDDAVDLTEMAGNVLADARTGKNGRHQLAAAAGVRTAGGLRRRERCRAVASRSGNALGGGGRAPMGEAASASRMGRFETEWLTRPENLAALADLLASGLTPCTGSARRESSCSTWIRARAPLMASRKTAPTTSTSAAPATTRCFVFNQLGWRRNPGISVESAFTYCSYVVPRIVPKHR
jgi:hypothetical protein